MDMSFRRHLITIVLIIFSLYGIISGQGTYLDFNTIPKRGTILIYAHQDDDLIWMLPFWNITEKFIGGAMPATPNFRLVVRDQQIFLNNNGYNIQYESNWITPWTDISDNEYSEYYWWNNPAYYYLSTDHLETKMANDNTPLSTAEINKIKAKLEQYIASTDLSRIITHNNWGEYGHQHHRALNKAVRELAVKYRKDVWMLGCDIYYREFIDLNVPNGITYTLGSFDDQDLFTGIRQIYQKYYRWTWYSDKVPSGDHKFIKIVDAGTDKSNILTGESIIYPGPTQNEPGAYIFDGIDDYMTISGNNDSPFTIAMRIRPDQIKAMDIARMAEYPLSTAIHDRDFYMEPDGRITARIYDGSSKTVTSNISLSPSYWAHIAITYSGSNLKLYVNGALQNTISAGAPITNYSTPELVLGQAANTDSFFAGQINDVQMYNRALTDEEIADISRMIFTLSASAGSGGTINPSGVMTLNAGSSMTLNITPNAGYRIANVSIDNVPAGPVSSYTFDIITSNHIIQATFEPITYSIQASAGSGGRIDPSGEVSAEFGSQRTFILTPDTGYEVADVLIDNVSQGPVLQYTFSNISQNHSITASFRLRRYTITSTAAIGGTIDPSGTISAEHGTSRTFLISPSTGFRILDVKADNISIGAVGIYTFNNITENHSLSATFTPITYQIVSSSETGGSISPAGTTIVNYGTNQSFSITPGEGFLIKDVMVDNRSVGAVSTYRFINIVSDHTISAFFNPITFNINAKSDFGGSIIPSGDIKIDYGSNQTFNFIPYEGYEISEVIVDNKSVGAITEYTFTNIKSNHSISVLYKLKTYTVTVSSEGGGITSPSGLVTVAHGSDFTLICRPSEGWRVSKIMVDNLFVSSDTIYILKNVRSDFNILVDFSLLNKYEIKASSGEGGNIIPSETIKVYEGSNLNFTVTPLPGFRISNVFVDNIPMGPIVSYNFLNISSNHQITAEFVNEIDYMVYPNPFNNSLKLQILSPDIFEFEIQISDILGNILYIEKKFPPNSIMEFHLNVPPGVYLISIWCRGTHIKTLRTLKQKY